VLSALTDSSFATDKDPLQGRLVDNVLKGRVETLEILGVGHD
jgi:hypothetical protein